MRLERSCEVEALADVDLFVAQVFALGRVFHPRSDDAKLQRPGVVHQLVDDGGAIVRVGVGRDEGSVQLDDVDRPVTELFKTGVIRRKVVDG